MQEIISQEVIESFLNGSDPENYIVGIEYDYQNNKIYKIIQDPKRGKIVTEDTFTAFAWVGDLSNFNFYNGSKSLQKRKMTEYGILSAKLNTGGNERLEVGLKHMVKSLKGYQALVKFFKDGGIDPWGDKFKSEFIILSPAEQY